QASLRRPYQTGDLRSATQPRAGPTTAVHPRTPGRSRTDHSEAPREGSGNTLPVGVRYARRPEACRARYRFKPRLYIDCGGIARVSQVALADRLCGWRPRADRGWRVVVA